MYSSHSIDINTAGNAIYFFTRKDAKPVVDIVRLLGAGSTKMPAPILNPPFCPA